MEQIPCLKDMLSCAGVTDFCVVLMNSSFILYPHKVSELGFTPNSAIVCLFPYYTQTPVTQTNLARYAWSKDYHIVVGNRLKEICAALKDCAPNYEFQGFTDNSPFLEKDRCV